MTDRWPVERAREWVQHAGWLVGCNFTPSTAGNQLEMWQADTFDPDTIDKELGWAAGLGMNTIRVYLHDLLFEADGESFLGRIDQVLELAAAYGITMVPVLFDGVWHPEPSLGAQPEPRPLRHNSVWVQGPGAEIMFDPSRWDSLEPYVSGVLDRFGDDPRVVAWDLFNEPDQIDLNTIRSGSRTEKAAAATALCDQVFDWARVVDPSQPITVGLWEYDDDHRPADNALNELILRRSDIISFHNYGPRSDLQTTIEGLAVHDRPMLCTEWLARSEGSTMDLLEVFADNGVGAINWGLVDGRTQTRYPWKSWVEPVTEDEPWFHELLHGDGTPYDPDEAALMRRLTGVDD